MPQIAPPMVGRAALLQDACRRALDGVGSVLTGPRGSGGGRLLAETVAALRRSGAAVAVLPDSAASPEHAFLSLLDRADAVRIEAAGPPSRGAQLGAALEALRLDALAVDAAAIGGLAADLLTALAETGTALVVNATGRTSVPDALLPLEAAGRLEQVPLPPLTDAEVAALAEHLLLDPVDAELAHALADLTGGRPGTLAEVVQDAVGTRAVRHTDGVWHLVRPLPSPRSVRSEVRDAFSGLPPDQRGWIAAVAIAGTIAADLAPRIAGPAATEGVDAAGWTVTEAGHVRIATVPARTSVTDSLDLRARVAVLRRLVEAVGSADRRLTDDERVALARWRIELGEPVDPLEALQLADRGGTPRETQELLLRAAVESGGAPAGAALADHLRRTRRPGEAIALIRAAMPGAATADERVQLVRVEAMTVGVVERRSAEALDALDEYLREYGPHADLLAVRAALLLLEARPQEALDSAGLALADPGRGAFADGFALLQVPLCLRELGQVRRSREAAERFAADDRAARAFPEGGALASWLPHELAVAGGLDLPVADAALTSLHANASADRLATHRPLYAYTLGCVRTQQGDPVAAAELLRDADTGAGGWRDGWRPRILAELAVAQALAGSTAEAAATLDRLIRIGSPPVQHGRLRLAQAQLAAARGDRQRAATLAAAVAARGVQAGLRLDAFDAEFAALRHGDRSAATRLLALGPDPAGEGRDAQRAYAVAVQAADPAAIDDAAVRLWAAGQRLHGIEAASVAAEAGSAVAARRLVAWLARTPNLRRPAGSQGGSIGLTTRERQVAVLAAAGASDRAIGLELGVTLRTAQTHLARAFAKLGVHRRADLCGLVDEQ
ncbi:LuxR C-terminal-related transcriptional regulator [uncultured Amnibacterium sp.]|uniref:helix-turn-helix transcriptional regulator n=1 Tax=uncultured Amnibacterium sp. TaxID=1631851 RepID=UPI0035CBA1B3